MIETRCNKSLALNDLQTHDRSHSASRFGPFEISAGPSANSSHDWLVLPNGVSSMQHWVDLSA